MQEPKIKQLYYNWFMSGNSADGIGDDWEDFVVGEKGVQEIREHLPQFEGDRLWYDIIVNKKLKQRIFNPNRVIRFD